MFEIDTKLSDEDFGVKLCNFKGRSTKRVYEFNFLGVVFDNHITWNSHVKQVLSRADKRVDVSGEY